MVARAANSCTLCGVRYLQTSDYSVVMGQPEFTRKHHKDDTNDQYGTLRMFTMIFLQMALQPFEGSMGRASGLPQPADRPRRISFALCRRNFDSGVWEPFATPTQLFALNKDDALPMLRRATPLGQLHCGIASDPTWGVRPDASSQ